MPVSDETATQLLASAGRIERAQEGFVVVADNILTALEVHTEKLDAILEAATKDPGPSPTAELLKEIVVALTAQSALLAALPDAFAKTVRVELEREIEEELEAEGGDAWEGEADAWKPEEPEEDLPQ